MKIKIYCLTILGFSALLFIGCVAPRSYNFWGIGGLSPIYPAMNYGYIHRYQTIDTLSPELKWRDVKKLNQTYDVAIWETPYRSIDDIKKKAWQPDSSWGIFVYSTNNITTNYFQLPIRLEPNTYYNWSVRVREGEKVKRWGSFSQEVVYGDLQEIHNNTPFGFKTPLQ
ncbi:MAG TPA: hypothetical protein VMO20_00935 [Candidatus Acidoferrum sp.]|nr:hypothetical protein [Candidatus Acidoferrum sp.]